MESAIGEVGESKTCGDGGENSLKFKNGFTDVVVCHIDKHGIEGMLI